MMMQFENDLFCCVVVLRSRLAYGWHFVLECFGEITRRIPLNSAASIRDIAEQRM
jgi:hypothetical protein